MTVVSEVDDSGYLRREVHFIKKDCDEISRETLSPADVNMTKVLESGVTISPAGLVNLLDVTDIADKESQVSRSVQLRLNYLQSHKDELIDVLKEKGLTSILEKDEN